MFWRKKLLLAFLLTALAFDLAAARIVCTTYPVWLLTRVVVQTAPGVDLTLLINPAAGCAHDFTPSAGDLRQASQAGTILIANGAKLDDHIVQSLRKVNPAIRVIQCADTDPAKDAHQFISPDTALFMAKNIMQNLSELTPENRAIYAQNFQQLKSQLDHLTARLRAMKPRRVVLQSALFLNLAQAANCQAIEIKSGHSDILAAHALKKLLRHIRQTRPAMLWCEKGSADNTVSIIRKSISIPAVQLDTMLSGPANPPGDYFVKVMRANLDAIEKAGK